MSVPVAVACTTVLLARPLPGLDFDDDAVTERFLRRGESHRLATADGDEPTLLFTRRAPTLVLPSADDSDDATTAIFRAPPAPPRAPSADRTLRGGDVSAALAAALASLV